MSGKRKATAAILLAAGIVCREFYRSKTLEHWTARAYAEGLEVQGAPTDLLTRDWTLPGHVSALGIIGLALIILGFVTIFLPTRTSTK